MKTLRSWLALATILVAATAHGQVVTPIPAPTIITTAPYTITKPGFYQLGADLTYTGSGASAIITIAASNVTLDFAGHYISGPSNNASTYLYGVYANEQGNINIQNGTIAFCYEGIYLQGNGTTTSLNINQRIENMLITYSYFCGISFLNSSDSEVEKCRITITGGTANSTNYIQAIFGEGVGLRYFNNRITTVNAGSHTSVGIRINPGSDAFCVGNTISYSQNGIFGSTYQNNLCNQCATNCTQGTNAGGNN